LRDYGRNIPKVQTNIHVKLHSSGKIDFITYATKYLSSKAIQTLTLFSQIYITALVLSLQNCKQKPCLLLYLITISSFTEETV